MRRFLFAVRFAAVDRLVPIDEVSMNSIMVDGTGMCGCCRLTCGGVTKYACVDGPEFDGHLIDWSEAINRITTYKEQEAAHKCRLTGEAK